MYVSLVFTSWFFFCHLNKGSLAYLTAATHGLAEECEEIKETFGLDPDTVSKVYEFESGCVVLADG